jgi:aryl-alcohol dehydrogenase-like predicted oxidoreductase
MPIPLRKLGHSTIEITPVGLGAWQFSEGKGFHGLIWKGLTPEQTDAIVQAALDGGINWFDTAEVYGNGRSEIALSRSLQQAGKQNGDVVIATKWKPNFRTAQNILKTFPQRVENLAPFAIDLYQIHNPASFSSPESEMDRMAALLDEGKIKAIGVSNFSAKNMARAHKRLQLLNYGLSSNQVKYSLLDRKIERNGVLEAAKELGITIIAYSPLEMGLLTGKFHSEPALLNNIPSVRRLALRRKLDNSRPLIILLESIAARHDVTVSQVALNWLMNYQGDSVVVIPGASKPHHAIENAGAMEFQLTPDELNEIDETSKIFT